MLVPVEVTSFGVDAESNSPVVVLGEQGGGRMLPVPIGQHEAGAIALQTMDVQSDKPRCVDLFDEMVRRLGGLVQKVVVVGGADSKPVARLFVVKEGKVHVMECRPSEAIALSMRCRAPIFADERVFGGEDAGKSSSESLRRSIRALDVVRFGAYYLE